MTESDLLRLAWQVPVTLGLVAVVSCAVGMLMGIWQRRVEEKERRWFADQISDPVKFKQLCDRLNRRKQECEPPEAA